MAGSFTVSLALLGAAEARSADHDVLVTVRGVNGFKGTVNLVFRALTNNPPPLYLTPTGASVYVPKNGSATTIFSVGVPVTATVVVEAVGTSGSQSHSATITLMG